MYLIAAEYITAKNQKYRLSSKGKKIGNLIGETDNLFVAEKEVFSKFTSSQISEAKIKRVLKKV